MSAGQAATARWHAEQLLRQAVTLTPAGAITAASGRLGWALLDVADAIREHAEATRSTRPPRAAYVNRGARG